MMLLSICLVGVWVFDIVCGYVVYVFVLYLELYVCYVVGIDGL